MAVSAKQKLELMKLADAVAREKSIDRGNRDFGDGRCHRQCGQGALTERKTKCTTESTQEGRTAAVGHMCGETVDNSGNQI